MMNRNSWERRGTQWGRKTIKCHPAEVMKEKNTGRGERVKVPCMTGLESVFNDKNPSFLTPSFSLSRHATWFFLKRTPTSTCYRSWKYMQPKATASTTAALASWGIWWPLVVRRSIATPANLLPASGGLPEEDSVFPRVPRGGGKQLPCCPLLLAIGS